MQNTLHKDLPSDLMIEPAVSFPQREAPSGAELRLTEGNDATKKEKKKERNDKVSVDIDDLCKHIFHR